MEVMLNPNNYVDQTNVSQYNNGFEYSDLKTSAGYANQAKASAEAAEASALKAGSYVDGIVQSAQEAAQSATEAQTSANDSATSASKAEASSNEAFDYSKRAQYAFVAASAAAHYANNYQEEAGKSATAAAASSDAAKAFSESANTSASNASASAEEATTSATEAKEYRDDSQEIYEAFAKSAVYRGPWNPSSGKYPDGKGTNSYWDVVLDEGEKSVDWNGITWHAGDRLIFSLPDSKYYHIAFPGGGVTSVNGKTGAVTLGWADVGGNDYFQKSSNNYVQAKSWVQASSIGTGFLPSSNGNSFLGTAAWWFKEAWVNTYKGGSVDVKDSVSGSKGIFSSTTPSEQIHIKRTDVSSNVGIKLETTNKVRHLGMRDDGTLGYGNSANQAQNAMVYTTNNKPTAADVGSYTKSETDQKIKDVAGAPVGTIMMFGHKAVPAGFIDLCVANPTFSVLEYPELAKLYPDGNLPSFLNRYPKGVPLSSVGYKGSWMIPEHTHDFSGNTGSVTLNGRFNTNEAGWHAHNIAGGREWDGRDGSPVTLSKNGHMYNRSTDGGGNHTHFVDVNFGAHSHTVNGVTQGIKEAYNKGSSLEVDRIGVTFAIKAAGKASDAGLMEVTQIKADVTDLTNRVEKLEEGGGSGGVNLGAYVDLWTGSADLHQAVTTTQPIGNFDEIEITASALAGSPLQEHIFTATASTKSWGVGDRLHIHQDVAPGDPNNIRSSLWADRTVNTVTLIGGTNTAALQTPKLIAVRGIKYGGGSGEDTGWIQNTAFLNGWKQFAPTSDAWAVKYRKKNGVVYLSGLVTVGTNQAVMTLPEGLRPTEGKAFMFSTMNAGAEGGVSPQTRVDVNPDGSVSVVNYARLSANSWVSLDLSFVV